MNEITALCHSERIGLRLIKAAGELWLRVPHFLHLRWEIEARFTCWAPTAAAGDRCFQETSAVRDLSYWVPKIHRNFL